MANENVIIKRECYIKIENVISNENVIANENGISMVYGYLFTDYFCDLETVKVGLRNLSPNQEKVTVQMTYTNHVTHSLESLLRRHRLCRVDHLHHRRNQNHYHPHFLRSLHRLQSLLWEKRTMSFHRPLNPQMPPIQTHLLRIAQE